MCGRLWSYLKTCESTNVCLHLLYCRGQECWELKKKVQKCRNVWRQPKSSVSEVGTVARKDNRYPFCGHLLQTKTSEQKHELRLHTNQVGEHPQSIQPHEDECADVTDSLCVSRTRMKSNKSNQLSCSVQLKQARYSSYSCSGSAMFEKGCRPAASKEVPHIKQSELLWPLEKTENYK